MREVTYTLTDGCVKFFKLQRDRKWIVTMIVLIGSIVCSGNVISRPVQLSTQWSLFNPEGISTLSNQSAEGFDFSVADVRGNLVEDPSAPGSFLTGNAVRPRVYQTFENLRMTGIGDAVEIRFDLELFTPLIENNRGDLHIVLFDTLTAYEMFSMIHLGVNAGRVGFMKFRIDGVLGATPGFNPVDLSGLGVGGQSRAGAANHPGQPLAQSGLVHSFVMRVERVNESEFSYRLTWNNGGNTSTHSFAAYDEATGVIDGQADPSKASDIWGNGKLYQFNGFALMLHDDDPFDQDNNDASFDSGTIRVSNLIVEHFTTNHPPFNITEVIKGEAGNTVRWEAVNGATYSLWSTVDFKNWLELNDSIIVEGNAGEFTDTESANSQSIYYQVRWDSENQQ